MKKILILSVTAGNCHNACARGMKRELEKSGDVEVKIVDLLKSYSSKLNVWVADGGYALAVSKLPKLYNAFYYHYLKAKPYKRYSCPSQSTVLTTLDGLLQEIISFRPDVIYCTHFYGAIALTDLKLVYDLPCKTIVSNLDYVNSPFWEAAIGVDYFIIPSEDFVEECIREGYRREQLIPLGLPVDERTLEVRDKAEARRELGLDENVFTALVMFGGGYWSGAQKIFKQLVKAFKGKKAQIIFISGKDKKSFERVRKMKFEDGIKVLGVGYTDNVPLYLSAADVVLNKCGGGSVTEMINKSVPMLLTENLVGQEKCNLHYLKGKGVVRSFKNGKDLKANILRMMEEPALLQEMSRKMLPLRKNATGDLGQFILSQPRADYSAFLASVESKAHPSAKKAVKAALKRADKAARKTARTQGGN